MAGAGPRGGGGGGGGGSPYAGGRDSWGCLRSAFPEIYDIAEDPEDKDGTDVKRGGVYLLRGEGLVLGRNRIALACQNVPDESKTDKQRAFHGLWNRVHRCGRTSTGRVYGHVRIYREGVHVYVEAIGKNGCLVSPGGMLKRGERRKVGERAFIVIVSSRWCKNPLPGVNSEQIAFEYRTNRVMMSQLEAKCDQQAELPYLQILTPSEKKFIGERYFPERPPYVRRGSRPPRWSPAVRALACGLHDPKCPLSRLRGQADLWRKIWGYLQEYWKDLVLCEFPKKIDDPELPYALLARNVRFPKPQGIEVTMLPFIPADRKSLPDKIAAYWPLVDACRLPGKDRQTVCYLTIRESLVREGEIQTRPGLHTESPGPVQGNLPEFFVSSSTQPMGAGKWLGPRVRLGWGFGSRVNGGQVGGVYMVSNMSDTIEVHASKILPVEGIMQPHGDCEHLRPLLKAGRTLQGGEMVWVTDTTPYESLPAPSTGFRQFFRLVTSCVDIWYKDRYTENPRVEANAFVLTADKVSGNLEIDFERGKYMDANSAIKTR